MIIITISRKESIKMSRHIQRLIPILINQKPALNSVRCYSRWTHRKPGKVILPFEPTGKVNLQQEKVIDLSNIKQQKTQAAAPKTMKVINADSRDEILDNRPPKIHPKKSKNILTDREEKIRKRKFYLSQKKVFDDIGDIIYEKMNDNDGRISTLLVRLKSKKDRQRSGQILVEGWRLIVDGLKAKCSLSYVLFSRLEELEKIKPFLPKTGVVFYKVPYKELDLFSDVETPSGIFGIFETPSAENIKRISNPLPLHIICDNIRMSGNLGAILRVAVGAGCKKVLLTKGCVDAWDPKVMRSAAGAHFRLPIHHSIDWKEMPTYMEPGSSVFIADSNSKVSDSEEDSGDELTAQIPVLPYYGVEFATMKHITLIIGGETEGISEDSYALAARHNGLRLNIPLQRGVDSLNTGMAAAVIALEIRKQLIQAWMKIGHAKLQGIAS